MNPTGNETPTPFALDVAVALEGTPEGAGPMRSVAGLDWGTGTVGPRATDGDDQRPVLLALHPNGFCAGIFDPIVQRLRHRFRPLGIDVLGHGRTEPPDTATFTLAEGAREVLGVLDALGIDRVDCVGHSLGGVVAILLDRERPGLIDRLVLCEPVIFPPAYERPPQDGPSIAELTRRRRAVWPDRAEMQVRFASRPPLDALHPDALAAYLRWGVVDRDDGDVELACPPEVEATIFDITAASPRGALPAWEHLAHLRARAVVVSGAGTNLPPVFELQAGRVGCGHVVVPGAHLFLHEDPTASAELLERLFDELGPPRP